jgi:DNA-binding CsgD family transcriptional regulator
MGKTTLLARASERVTAAGVRVVRSRATERSAHQPFAAVEFLLGELSADPVAAALTTVDAWTSEGSVLLWIDDAHHLDAASATVLARVARACRSLPLTLLLSARPHPRNPELTRLLELCTVRITLEPLTDEEVVALVRDHLGGTPGPHLLDQLRLAGGNPFFLELLLDLLEHRGALGRHDGVLEVDPLAPTVAGSSAASVRAVLARLPTQSRELMAVVAVLGPPALPEDVSAVAGLPLTGLSGLLEPAVDAGVLEWALGGLAFAHDLYAEAVLEEIAAPVQAALHRKAMEVLNSRNADARQIAEHAWRGGGPEAVPLVRSVAADIVKYAPEVAAGLLAQVQPLIDPEDTDELVADRAEALLRAGRGREAEDLIRSYLPRASAPEQRARLHNIALTSVIHRGNTAAAHAEIENLLAFGDLAEPVRIELLDSRGWLLVLDGQLTAAELLEEDAARARLGSGDHPSETAANLAFLHGRPADALRLDQETHRPVEEDHVYPVFPPLYELYAHGPGAAERLSHAGRRASADRDLYYVLQFHDYVLGNIYLLAGRWDDAAAAFESGLEIGDECGSMGLAAPHGGVALIDAHRGKLDAARARIALIAEAAFPIQFGRDYAGLAATALAEAQAVATATNPGALDWDSVHTQALSQARRIWDEAVVRGGELWIATIAGYVIRVADEALRRDVVGTMRRFPTGQMPVLDPIRDQVLGMHERDYGRVNAAAQAFLDASHPLAAGFAWEESGLLAARNGQSSVASKTLKRAVDTYDGLGAMTDLDRLRARAQRLGIRTTRPRVRRTATTGWEALTPTEHTVAELVREGLTNPDIARRMFLSPATVQTHVSHVLQKLQLKSRIEVAALQV